MESTNKYMVLNGDINKKVWLDYLPHLLHLFGLPLGK